MVEAWKARGGEVKEFNKDKWKSSKRLEATSHNLVQVTSNLRRHGFDLY